MVDANIPDIKAEPDKAVWKVREDAQDLPNNFCLLWMRQ
jgi:hypothetical protein